MKSPDEIGYYWGGFEDIDKPFYFSPFDYYKTTREDAAGNPADPAFFTGKDRLTDYGKAHIDGIEGLLWGENMTSNDAFEYMATLMGPHMRRQGKHFVLKCGKICYIVGSVA